MTKMSGKQIMDTIDKAEHSSNNEHAQNLLLSIVRHNHLKFNVVYYEDLHPTSEDIHKFSRAIINAVTKHANNKADTLSTYQDKIMSAIVSGIPFEHLTPDNILDHIDNLRQLDMKLSHCDLCKSLTCMNMDGEVPTIPSNVVIMFDYFVYLVSLSFKYNISDDRFFGNHAIHKVLDRVKQYLLDNMMLGSNYLSNDFFSNIVGKNISCTKNDKFFQKINHISKD